jgi:vacuolar protein sorting-associated protein 35
MSLSKAQSYETYTTPGSEIPMPSIDISKVFFQINELLQIIQSSYPEVTLRLYLQAAQVVNNIHHNANLDEQSYDFISQALLIYQDELSDSDQKMAAIKLIVATISHLKHFSPENYDTLATNTQQYCQKLLKKPDQCEALTLCLHLYTNQGFENTDQFDKIISKVLKIAAVCMQTPKNLILLVTILNKYLFYIHKNS